MEIIKGKQNGNIYMISFWTFFGWMFVGPVVFIAALLIILSTKDPNFELTYEYLMSGSFVSASMIIEVISDILPLTFALVFFKKIFIIDFVNFKNNLLKNILIILGGIILIYGVGSLLEIIYEDLGIKGEATNQEIIEQAINSKIRPIMFVMVVILAPIMEELIFRKFLFGYMMEKQKQNKWVAFVVSALVFSLIHVISSPADFIFLPQYLSLALIISLSYVLSKFNIYVTIVIHLLNNLIAFMGI